MVVGARVAIFIALLLMLADFEGEIGNECWRGEEEEEEEEAPLLLIYYWLQCQFEAESSFFRLQQLADCTC